MTMQKTFSLPRIFSDGMILQRNKPICVFGMDCPNQTIRILFKSLRYETKPNLEGRWSIELDECEAGGPYTLNIDGSELRIIHDVYVGEVWLLGGQSNMELPVSRTYDEFKEEIDHSNFPQIRQFHVPMNINFIEPQDQLVSGEWKAATQENIQDFSSVGFFFAKKLYEELNIPIGLIHTAVGGTPIQAWMSEESLNKVGGYEEEISYWRNPMTVEQDQLKDEMRINVWHKESLEQDIGLQQNWFASDKLFDDWETINIPIMFKHTEKLNLFSGVIWLKRRFELSESDLQSDFFRLRLGTLINADETYINGEKIGETGYRFPPRKYNFNKSVLKVGENILTVRLSIEAGNGGFIPDFPYQLEMNHRTVSLDGEWKYKIGVKKNELEPMLFLHYKPTGLYNAMIHPLKKYGIAGFLFYQGESNTKDPYGYADLMKLMIEDWRNLFGEDLPFYYAQLANYLEPAGEEDDHNFAVLREEQSKVRSLVPNTEMISAIDIGISNELHPPDKKTLAERFARISLARVYNQSVIYENPEITEVILNVLELDTGKKNVCLSLCLKGVYGKLERINGKQPLIEILAKNDEWVMVNADIHSPNTIEIPIDRVEECISIKAIRYAWRNDPKGLLIDSYTSLPVLPFYRELK